MAPSWAPVGLDLETARAIEERTWPRTSHVVRGLDHSTARAIEERTWPKSSHTLIEDAKPAPVEPPPVESGARYQLGVLIGSGGMGEVYSAYDSQLGREVAIKRLHANRITPDSLARFVGEARIQGWLDHPAIPSVYELGRDSDGRPFFVMKRLSGITLEEILADRESADSQFTEQQLLRAFVEICLAIEFAHTRGVLHRDLKPANMLLGQFGEVYVLDWGVARVREEGPTSEPHQQTLVQIALTAGALGTPGYMSPEQICNGNLDGRADVYALGCVLFEILTGRRLHPGGLAGMTSALAGADSPSTYRHDVAPELDELCRRATAVDPNDRITSARALGEAVQRYLDGDREPSTSALVEEADRVEQRRMANTSIGIYVAYACLAPVLFALGIRDTSYLAALVVIAAGNIAIAQRRPQSRIVVALGHAVMFGLIARMFTPLFIAPGLVAVILMGYAQHPATTRRTLFVGSGFALVAVLGVLGAEVAGWISATTIVHDGIVELRPPLDGVTGFPILPALCCYAIVLVIVAVELTYSIAQRGRVARRELHQQTWQLRQLVSVDSLPTNRVASGVRSVHG